MLKHQKNLQKLYLQLNICITYSKRLQEYLKNILYHQFKQKNKIDTDN